MNRTKSMSLFSALMRMGRIFDQNILNQTDVYGISRLLNSSTPQKYAHLYAESNKFFDKTVFFGLQYYLKQYFTTPITHSNVDNFMTIKHEILGKNDNDINMEKKLRELANLGYIPLEIKAVEEGTVTNITNKHNILVSIESTCQYGKFNWTVGLAESLLSKLWYPITVATTSYKYREIIENYSKKTYSSYPTYMMNDIGYRDTCSEEDASISGASHLLSFRGSDNIVALNFLKQYYNVKPYDNIMSSSKIYGHRYEYKDEETMLSKLKNIREYLYSYCNSLKYSITCNRGTIIIRIDDDKNLEHIICGNPETTQSDFYGKGLVEFLCNTYGYYSFMGYKFKNGSVRLICDNISLEEYQNILRKLEKKGYASSNLLIGAKNNIRNYTKDTLDFSSETTNYSDCSLRTVYKNGELLVDESFSEIRNRIEQTFINK